MWAEDIRNDYKAGGWHKRRHKKPSHTYAKVIMPSHPELTVETHMHSGSWAHDYNSPLHPHAEHKKENNKLGRLSKFYNAQEFNREKEQRTINNPNHWPSVRYEHDLILWCETTQCKGCPVTRRGRSGNNRSREYNRAYRQNNNKMRGMKPASYNSCWRPINNNARACLRLNLMWDEQGRYAEDGWWLASEYMQHEYDELFFTGQYDFEKHPEGFECHWFEDINKCIDGTCNCKLALDVQVERIKSGKVPP